MRPVISLAVSVAVLACLASPGQAQFRRPGRGENPAVYGWLSSLAQGKAQAAREGKPMMVVLRCVP